MGSNGASGGGRLASSTSPVFLRAALGVTFIWAGLGKLVPSVTVDPLSAAILANLGAIAPEGATQPPPPAQVPGTGPVGAGDGLGGGGVGPSVEPVPAPQVPKQPLPEPQIDAPAEPAAKPSAKPAAKPAGETGTGKPPARPTREASGPSDRRGVAERAPSKSRMGETAPGPQSSARSGGTPTFEQPADGDARGDAMGPDGVESDVWAAAAVGRQPEPSAPGRGGALSGTAVGGGQAARRALKPEPARYPLHLPQGKYTPADFPRGASVRRMHEMTLLLVRASHPAPGPDGKPMTALWPRTLGTDPLVRAIPLLAALTELLAGLCVLVGFFTRTGAALLACVMLSAMWLTQIGPSVQVGATVLGFIPARTWWDPKEYTVLLWQLSVLACGLALAFAGPGALSLDRALSARGGGAKGDADEE